MIVYKATNKINGKQYIGYTTKPLEERIKVHLYKANTKNNKYYFYLFKVAIRKYGIDNFFWETLKICSSIKECCEQEKYFIKLHNTIAPYGYNLTEGGNGGLQSETTKQKISNTVKEFWDNNKETHHWFNTDKRKEWAKKSWETKRKKGIISNRKTVKWINVNTLEEVELTVSEMSAKTGVSITVFSVIKNKKQLQSKNGWRLLES